MRYPQTGIVALSSGTMECDTYLIQVVHIQAIALDIKTLTIVLSPPQLHSPAQKKKKRQNPLTSPRRGVTKRQQMTKIA
jgi:hypothetical protein